MIGLFQEHGPCGIDANGSVYNNPYSWNNASNMLYIDQPVQTGFSYSIPVPGYVDSSTDNVIALPSPACPDYAADMSCGTYSYPNVSLTANSTDNAAPNFYRALQGLWAHFLSTRAKPSTSPRRVMAATTGPSSTSTSRSRTPISSREPRRSNWAV